MLKVRHSNYNKKFQKSIDNFLFNSHLSFSMIIYIYYFGKKRILSSREKCVYKNEIFNVYVFLLLCFLKQFQKYLIDFNVFF